MRFESSNSSQGAISRNMSWLLRHAAKDEGLPMRPDGYVSVEALLLHRTLRGVDFTMLEKIVREDQKSRYHLVYGAHGSATSCWWIRANQGHSMSDIEVDLKRIKSPREIPMAVHGTSMRAWELISKHGLSRMTRNHIHLAQGLQGDVISGMRSSSEVHIFVDVARALEEGIKFYVSSNDVVLTPGNEAGFLERRFFSRVERVKVSEAPITGWEDTGGDDGRGVDADPVAGSDADRVVDGDADAKEGDPGDARARRKARRLFYEQSMRKKYQDSELELV
ncbi:KptA family-domain-containing protein [Mycena sp. CBHHK59/15]|nr:KptA family-domain-containing protein [Mycena sp. CBHHK59/15]